MTVTLDVVFTVAIWMFILIPFIRTKKRFVIVSTILFAIVVITQL